MLNFRAWFYPLGNIFWREKDYRMWNNTRAQTFFKVCFIAKVNFLITERMNTFTSDCTWCCSILNYNSLLSMVLTRYYILSNRTRIDTFQGDPESYGTLVLSFDGQSLSRVEELFVDGRVVSIARKPFFSIYGSLTGHESPFTVDRCYFHWKHALNFATTLWNDTTSTRFRLDFKSQFNFQITFVTVVENSKWKIYVQSYPTIQ